jgi:hypothetical protein
MDWIPGMAENWVYPGPDGTYQTSDDYMRTQMVTKVIEPEGSGFATVSLADFRPPNVRYSSFTNCVAELEVMTSTVEGYYAYGNYTSSQTSSCTLDPNGYAFFGSPTIKQEWDFYMRGSVVSSDASPAIIYDPDDGIEIWIESHYDTENLWWTTGPNTPISWPNNGNGMYSDALWAIDKMRVEYFDALRGDLNKDGGVDFSDFTIFKGNWAKGNACWCSRFYFPP